MQFSFKVIFNATNEALNQINASYPLPLPSLALVGLQAIEHTMRFLEVEGNPEVFII